MCLKRNAKQRGKKCAMVVTLLFLHKRSRIFSRTVTLSASRAALCATCRRNTPSSSPSSLLGRSFNFWVRAWVRPVEAQCVEQTPFTTRAFFFMKASWLRREAGSMQIAMARRGPPFHPWCMVRESNISIAPAGICYRQAEVTKASRGAFMRQ